MKIYLASRYSRREEMLEARALLEAHGHTVTSRWINGAHQISDTEMSDDKLREAKAHFAREDMEDLLEADCTISFTEEPRSSNSRGGRHVEFGVARAEGQLCVVIGPAENVFHLLPGVLRFDTLKEALPYLTRHNVPATAKTDLIIKGGHAHGITTTRDLVIRVGADGPDIGHAVRKLTLVADGSTMEVKAVLEMYVSEVDLSEVQVEPPQGDPQCCDCGIDVEPEHLDENGRCDSCAYNFDQENRNDPTEPQ